MLGPNAAVHLLPDLEAGDAIFAARDVELPESAYLGLIAIAAKVRFSVGDSGAISWTSFS